MESKDDLIARIQKLEAKHEEDAKKEAELKIILEQNRKIKDDIEVVLEEVRKRYIAARDSYNGSVADRNDLKFDMRTDQEELDRLKRQLSRELDREQVNVKYLQQVEAFKDKCLEAPWRAENRTDGRGALPHQIDGAMHLAVAKTALLGDKRGLGKTLTGLVTCDFLETMKAICIVPSDTMDNFIREIKMWTPHRKPIKLGKMTKAERGVILPVLKQQSDYMLVMNYEAWRKDYSLIDDLIGLKADTLILDEAHRGKTLKTSAGQGIQAIRFGLNECPKCASDSIEKLSSPVDHAECLDCEHVAEMWKFCSIKNVIPMTGTPILNRPQELFPLLRLIDPENNKTEKQYLRDFCQQDLYTSHWKWKAGGEKKVIEKIGHRYLARDRKAAGVIIPPATPQLHLITMDEIKENYPNQHKAYEQCRKYAQLVLDPDTETTMSMPVFLTVLLRLRQVLTWPAAIELKKPVTDEEGKVLYHEVVARLDVHESAKLDKAEELMREIIDEGERVVLFSQFKMPLEILQARLGGRTAIYNGDTSSYRKQQIQLDFDPKTVKAQPQYDAVLCNYKAAGEGLNFNAASQMIILDEEWNPGRQSQAYGRIDRLGQTRETTIHTIRVENSVDTWMAGLLEEKLDLVSGFEDTANMYRKMFDDLRKGNL
jgi:SNF2 family DNA or RNA helicase